MISMYYYRGIDNFQEICNFVLFLIRISLYAYLNGIKKSVALNLIQNDLKFINTKLIMRVSYLEIN